MRLGIFGGTFNPPHMGHIRLVTAIADKLQLADVRDIQKRIIRRRFRRTSTS